MTSVQKIIFSILGSCCGQLLQAQNIGEAMKKPFVLSGTVGVSSTFYSSNESIKSRPTFAWNVYGNVVGKTGKWTLPLSFVINQYNNSNASPYVQIGFSPTYEWARFHLGYGYIPFSPLTFEGQSFRGVGVELYPKRFRFAAFYGRLNKAVNEDTSSGRFKVPQFSRTGYGIKVGIGNVRNFLDLIYFHAKDDSGSASLVRGATKSFLKAQENAVVGSSFRLTIAKKWVWTGDAAVSGLIQDQSGKRNLDTANQGLRNFISHFLPTNSTLAAHYATQSSVVYYDRWFNSNLAYRRVQPGFKSLGTPYMLDDVELISWINGVTLLKGKLSIGTNLSQQHNNLSKTLAAALQTQVANINANAILGQHFNLNLNFSGYNLRQRNDQNSLPDSLRLPDSVLLHQQVSQYTISPGYNITKGNHIHYFNGNLTYQKLTDKNARTAAQTNSNNLSTSLLYTLAFINKPYSFSIDYLHSRFQQPANSYTSNGVTLGASAQLLKSKRWNMQGNVGYFSNAFNANNKQRNTSYSFNSSYRSRHHSIRVFVNYVYTPPNNAITQAINKTIPYAVASKYVYGGASYYYSF